VHDDAIWVMTADGSHGHQVFKEEADTPSWSPDGRHIVFTAVTGYTGWITVMRADGSHRRRISPNDYGADPSWSVRGQIAYSDSPEYFLGRTFIVTRRTDGRLVSRFRERRHDVSNADFSPDGKLIAYERGDSIWTARPDGSHRRRVVAGGSQPAWSPSGRFIAYSRSVGPSPAESEIFIARRDGSHRHQLGPSPRRKGDRRGDYIEPAWQPLPRR
jgi:Tol biopolymer transport system component